MIRKSSHSSRETDPQVDNEVSPPPSVRRRISFLNELNRIAGAQLASFDPVIYQETISGILRPCLYPDPTETSVSVPNLGCARGEWSASGSLASGLSLPPADGDVLSPSLPVPIPGSEQNIGFTEDVSVPNSNSGCARGGQSDGGYVFPSARHSDRPADGENTSPSLPIPSGMDTEDMFRSPFDCSHHSPNRHADGEASVSVQTKTGSQEVSGHQFRNRPTDLSGRDEDHSDHSGRLSSQEFSDYYFKPRQTDQSGRGGSQDVSRLYSDSRRNVGSGRGSQEVSGHHCEPRKTDQSGRGGSQVVSRLHSDSRHNVQNGRDSQEVSGQHQSEPLRTDQSGRGGSQDVSRLHSDSRRNV